MPTRPSQTPPAQIEAWQRRREQVGARIRELRLAQDLSQEALGLEAGLHRSMVIGVEWGRKSLAYERLWDIANVLGVDITELFIDPTGPSKVEPQEHGSARSSTRARLSTEPA